jgi:hypothetical protein
VERQNSILTGESETDFQSPVNQPPVQQQDGKIQDATSLAEDNGDECESGDMDEDASCSLHGGGAGSAIENLPSLQHEPSTSNVSETVVGDEEEHGARKAETATETASMGEAAATAPMTGETTPAETTGVGLTSNDSPVTQVLEPESIEEIATGAKVVESPARENHETENDKNKYNDNNEASTALSSPDTPPPFVNEGLLRWEKARMSWLSHQHQRGGGSGDEDDSSFSCKPAAPAIPLDVDEIIDVIFASPRQWRVNEGGSRKFPQPVPLPQLVDLLQGMYICSCWIAVFVIGITRMTRQNFASPNVCTHYKTHFLIDLWEAEGIDP